MARTALSRSALPRSSTVTDPVTQQARWVLASDNAGKIREFNELLAPLAVTVLPQGDFGVSSAEETACTFVENALIKARHACEQTGLPALADDSGIAVDALQGAPGIYSARYAGAGASDQDNIDALLAAMADVPEGERQAAYHCVLVFMTHATDPTPLICHGRWQGELLTAPTGTGGFGYDPLFYLPEEGVSVANLPSGRKRLLSHRAQALHQLMASLGLHSSAP
ncbi:MAG: RdgB/HAM1 family non-canonical purine NTP pyrophosphatase [Halomonadaceae bacterium]|nr:MAG: RdgB/HAM1 family non-canonical purine NTP pyrophosphatase [Halomonadaceae bacterium]